MLGVEEVFDSVFSCLVDASSFRLPGSVQELRTITERVVRDSLVILTAKESCAGDFWGQEETGSVDQQSASRKHGGQRQQSQDKENEPIGLNSLRKTFNIIKIVGQGEHQGVVPA